MATFNQLVRHRRRPNLRRYNRSPKMGGCPQRLGICIRVGTTKPKKPNSAIRKICKVRLATGYNVRAVIPGSGFNLVEHNTVLLQAGRARDIPGIHYRLIRGVADLGPPSGFERRNRRSKFGVANWAYIVRQDDGLVSQVVSRVRTLRQRFQVDVGLTPTWEPTPVVTLARPVWVPRPERYDDRGCPVYKVDRRRRRG